MYKIAIYYEGATLGRNDGNPLYVTSFLKRAQFYINQIAGKNLNEDLLRYFPTKGNDDLSAKEFAQWFFETFNDSFQVDRLRPAGDLHTYGDYDLNIWIHWGS